MNNYKIITTDAAQEDIRNISGYIAKDNLRAAIAITKLFKNLIFQTWENIKMESRIKAFSFILSNKGIQLHTN